MRNKVAVGISIGLLLASNSWAENETEVILDKIVVTPGRVQEQLAEAPANITVITRGEIERSKAKTLPELLTRHGAVTVMDLMGNGKSTFEDIRGFGEAGLSNILVLIDGRKVNNLDLSGTDWTQIPISMVERVEIIRGASSVLYGDNASAGVVNIITKEPSGKKYEIKPGLLVGSYNTYGENIEASFNADKLSGFALFDQYRTEGYRINSDLIRNDINAKAVLKLNDYVKTKLTFGNHHDKYGLPGALLDDQLNVRGRRASVTPDDYASSRDYFVDFGVDADLQDFGRLELSGARRKRDTTANFVATLWETGRDTITYTANTKYLLDKEIAGHKNRVILGMDYFDAEQDVVDGITNPDKLTLSKKNYGFYLTDQIHIIDKLSYTGGYRYEKVHYNFEQEAVLLASDASKFSQNLLSSALNYNYKQDSNIYVSFQESFRHPMVDEFFFSKFDFGFGPGGGLNSGLNPQTGDNYEAGIRHAFNDKISAGLCGYIMYVSNEIYLEPSTFTNINYDKTIHQGVEASSETKLNERLRLIANYTFTDARFRGGIYDKNQIPLVPRHKWGIASELKINPSLRLSASGNYVGERYFVSDQTNILPRMASYFVVDTKLTFEKGNLSAFFGINNLFQEEYYEFGSANGTRVRKNYYPAPERNLFFGGSVKF